MYVCMYVCMCVHECLQAYTHARTYTYTCKNTYRGLPGATNPAVARIPYTGPPVHGMSGGARVTITHPSSTVSIYSVMHVYRIPGSPVHGISGGARVIVIRPASTVSMHSVMHVSLPGMPV